MGSWRARKNPSEYYTLRLVQSHPWFPTIINRVHGRQYQGGDRQSRSENNSPITWCSIRFPRSLAESVDSDCFPRQTFELFGLGDPLTVNYDLSLVVSTAHRQVLRHLQSGGQT